MTTTDPPPERVEFFEEQGHDAETIYSVVVPAEDHGICAYMGADKERAWEVYCAINDYTERQRAEIAELHKMIERCRRRIASSQTDVFNSVMAGSVERAMMNDSLLDDLTRLRAALPADEGADDA